MTHEGQQLPLTADFELIEQHVTPMRLPQRQVNYHRGEVPHDYRCQKCGANPCKLWQDRSGTVLLCAPHAAEQEGINPDDIDQTSPRIENIGMMHSAVPNPLDSSEMWSYHEIPSDGMCWWRNLSTFPI